MPPRFAVAPLAALTFAATMATTRFGLIAHELVGHGLTAVAFGAHVTGLHLFWFGGGWITFSHDGPWGPGQAFLVQLGGIGVEWLLAAALYLIARRCAGLARLVLVGCATGFVVHGGIYLADGTFYGLGDGRLVHEALGPWRVLVWLPAAAVCIAATYLGARTAVELLRVHAPARTPGRQLAVVVVALAVGGGAALGLARAELALRPNPTYAAIMKTEGQRAVDREVAQVRAARPQASEAQIAAVRRAAEQRHRVFPFGPILIGLIVVAGAGGAARSRPAAAPEPLPWRRLAAPAAVAAAGVALVAALATLA